MAEDCKCKLSKKEQFMQAFTGFAHLMSFPAQLYFTYICSKRASKHAKKFKLVTPKHLTFRIYQSEISGGAFCSVSLWAYSIPTLFLSAVKGVEEIGQKCYEYIEINLVVPSSRHWQADLLMRQHIHHSYPGIIIITPPPVRDGHSTLEYADHQPMFPHGIPYKPVMFTEKMMIWIFQGQLNDLPNSHKTISKQGGLKRKKQQTVVLQNVDRTQNVDRKPNPVRKTSRPTTRKKAATTTKRSQQKNAKLFD